MIHTEWKHSVQELHRIGVMNSVKYTSPNGYFNALVSTHSWVEHTMSKIMVIGYAACSLNALVSEQGGGCTRIVWNSENISNSTMVGLRCNSRGKWR